MAKKPVQMMAGLLMVGVLMTTGCRSSETTSYGNYGGSGRGGMMGATNNVPPQMIGAANQNGTIYSAGQQTPTRYSAGGQPSQIPGGNYPASYTTQQPANMQAAQQYYQQQQQQQQQPVYQQQGYTQPAQQGNVYHAPSGQMTGMPRQ